MKYPSLDNAEGIAVLVGLCAAGYVLYKLATGATSIANSITGTLTDAENAVSNVVSGVEGIAKSATDSSGATTASDNMGAAGDTGIDGIANWPLPVSLGSDSTTTSGTPPNAASPSAVQITNDLTGDW